MLVPLLRSILYALVFYSGTLVTVLGAFPVALAGPRRLRRHASGWAHFHSWCARALLGIRSRVEGTIPQGQVLFAAKHEAMYETTELIVLLDEPVVVVKRELADIPLWGWAARRYGVIPVDRGRSATALRSMLAAADAARRDGRTVVIFPEGTRVAPGEAPPLRPGFAGLYKRLGLPVVPVAIDSGRVWPRGFMKRPGTITFRFGKPIPPGLPRQEIEARVHAGINALAARE